MVVLIICCPKPYRFAWLQKGQQLLVNEQCQVKFHIGNYQDEVRCDIIEMDACHVLLGRPSKFDRETVHEGKMNVYSFEMNGKRHRLHPFRRKQEESSNQLPMMTDKRIVNDWKVEYEVKIISQVYLSNNFEAEMTNEVCNDWLKEGMDKHGMSNASMELM